MDAAIYKALSGAVVEMRRLEGAAQDLANINTAGYKSQRLAFSEVLAKGAPRPERPGGFVAVAAQRTNLNQGAIDGSGNPFHLALEGDGYFVVQTPRGERYTRNGGFTQRADGTLITPAGDAVLGEGGPIQLSGATMEVAADGTVRSGNNEIGKLRLVRFTDGAKVEKEGANLFRSDGAKLTDASDARVVQAHLEQSNVSAVDGMVALININRQFESYQRAMKLLDGVTEKMLSDSAR